MKQLYVKSSQEWRQWLSANHQSESEVWLIFYKKASGEPSLEYETAVEEALCFGWIDSIIKKIDDHRYARKFTPRKDNSKWSESNKKRIAKLIDDGRITEYGLAKVEIAKQNGQWDKDDRPQIGLTIPAELKKALASNKKAKEFFNALAPSYQKQYIGWISAAKRPETKDKRVQESIALLENEQRLGLR